LRKMSSRVPSSVKCGPERALRKVRKPQRRRDAGLPYDGCQASWLWNANLCSQHNRLMVTVSAFRLRARLRELETVSENWSFLRRSRLDEASSLDVVVRLSMKRHGDVASGVASSDRWKARLKP